MTITNISLWCRLFVFSGPCPWLPVLVLSPSSNLHLTVTASICSYRPWPLTCIYRSCLITVGSHKSEIVRIMSVSLFLRSNFFITVMEEKWSKSWLKRTLLYVCVHIKTIPWNFRFLKLKKFQVICPWSL